MAISISKETEKQVRDYAKAREIEAPEALSRLVTTALGRLAAVNKYAKAHAGKTVRAPKKSKKAKK